MSLIWPRLLDKSTNHIMYYIYIHIQIVDQHIMISNAGLPTCICQLSGVSSSGIVASEMSLALRHRDRWSLVETWWTFKANLMPSEPGKVCVETMGIQKGLPWLVAPMVRSQAVLGIESCRSFGGQFKHCSSGQSATNLRHEISSKLATSNKLKRLCKTWTHINLWKDQTSQQENHRVTWTSLEFLDLFHPNDAMDHELSHFPRSGSWVGFPGG